MLNMMLLNPSQQVANGNPGTSVTDLGSGSNPTDFAARLQNLVDVQQGAKKSTTEKHTPQEVLLTNPAPSELKPGLELNPGDKVQPLPIEAPEGEPLIALNVENSQPLVAPQSSLSADILSRIEQAQALAQQLTQTGKNSVSEAKGMNTLAAAPSNVNSNAAALISQIQQAASQPGVTVPQNANALSTMQQTLKAGDTQLVNMSSQTLSANQTAALQMAMQLSGQERATLPAGAMPESNPFLADAKLPQTPQQPMPTWQPLATPVPIKQAMPVAESALQGLSNIANASAASTTANSEQANLVALQTANASVASSNATPTGTLTAPLASNAWQQQLSQQVVNMNFRQDNQVALRLHPAELGPLMINLRMDDQSASLQFSATNANVRAALETAIPHLRELLAEQGIELAESSVNDGQAQQQNQEQSSGSSELADNSLNVPTPNIEESPNRELDIQVGNGQIDLYA